MSEGAKAYQDLKQQQALYAERTLFSTAPDPDSASFSLGPLTKPEAERFVATLRSIDLVVLESWPIGFSIVDGDVQAGFMLDNGVLLVTVTRKPFYVSYTAIQTGLMRSLASSFKSA